MRTTRWYSDIQARHNCINRYNLMRQITWQKSISIMVSFYSQCKGLVAIYIMLKTTSLHCLRNASLKQMVSFSWIWSMLISGSTILMLYCVINLRYVTICTGRVVNRCLSCMHAWFWIRPKTAMICIVIIVSGMRTKIMSGGIVL